MTFSAEAMGKTEISREVSYTRSRGNMKVLTHKELAPSIFELTLQGELVSEMKQPGQFVDLVKTTDGKIVAIVKTPDFDFFL